jgi:hypothetical protein
MPDNIFDIKAELVQEPDANPFAPATTEPESLPAVTDGNILDLSKYLAASTMIPQQYQGKPANCFVALELARRVGASPLMVMQNLDIIHGRPSWSAKFQVAVANDCGRFTPVRYKMTGEKGKDSWGCIAWFKELPDGEVLEGPEVTIAMAKAEGWYSRKSKSGAETSKWQSMPEVMLRYRAATFLIRAYAPELTMGLHVKEEIEDMINVTPQGPVQAEDTAAEREWEARKNGTV